MTAKQREAIERHGRNVLAIFPSATEQDPVALCKKLRRLETAAHNAAVRWLSVPDTRGEADAVFARVEAQVTALLACGEGTDTPRVFVNRDPRGYALKIEDEYVRANGLQIHRDWGGYGILAPEIDG